MTQMRIFTSPAEVPTSWGRTVVTLGTFDGVHAGHRQLFRRMRRIADEALPGDNQRVRTVAITFDSHPLELHRPHDPPTMITGVYERRRQLESAQLDGVMLLEYCWALAALTPEEFIRRYVVEGLNATTIVIGRDVRFGRGNSGDLATLEMLGTKYGFDVVACDDWCGSDESDAGAEADGESCAEPHPVLDRRRLSSTWVREALRAGRVAEAAEVLGRRHSVLGQLGPAPAEEGSSFSPGACRLSIIEGMLPGSGLYSCWVSRPGAAPSTGLVLVGPAGSGAADAQSLTVLPLGSQWEPEPQLSDVAGAVRVEFVHALGESLPHRAEDMQLASVAACDGLSAHDLLVSQA